MLQLLAARTSFDGIFFIIELDFFLNLKLLLTLMNALDEMKTRKRAI
jgi:hypothetical protein